MLSVARDGTTTTTTSWTSSLSGLVYYCFRGFCAVGYTSLHACVRDVREKKSLLITSFYILKFLPAPYISFSLWYYDIFLTIFRLTHKHTLTLSLSPSARLLDPLLHAGEDGLRRILPECGLGQQGLSTRVHTTPLLRPLPLQLGPKIQWIGCPLIPHHSATTSQNRILD